MARLIITGVTVGDVEYALAVTGMAKRPYAAEEGDDDDVVVLDVYDAPAFKAQEIDTLVKVLAGEGLQPEVEAIDGWPPRGWAYAAHPVQY